MSTERWNLKEVGYDEEGNLREVTDAYNETISEMTYDEVGNLAETTDALGNTVTSEYDALNRLVFGTMKTKHSGT